MNDPENRVSVYFSIVLLGVVFLGALLMASRAIDTTMIVHAYMFAAAALGAIFALVRCLGYVP